MSADESVRTFFTTSVIAIGGLSKSGTSSSVVTLSTPFIFKSDSLRDFIVCIVASESIYSLGLKATIR